VLLAISQEFNKSVDWLLTGEPKRWNWKNAVFSDVFDVL